MAAEGRLEYSPAKVLRAFRRRWLSALGLGVLGMAAAGGAAHVLVRLTYTARTEVYIPPERSGSPFVGLESRGDAATQQRRHSAFVRSRHVLQAALQRPGVADLTYVRENSDPAGALERELLVDFAAPEIMRITLKGAPPEELLSLLNAVREAYLEEGVNREATEMSATLQWYRQVVAEDQAKLEKAQTDVGKKAGELNAPDAATIRLRYQNDLTQLANLRTLRFQLEVKRKGLIQAREALVAAPPAGTVEPALISQANLQAATEFAVGRDPESVVLKTTIDRLEKEIAEYKRVMPKGSKNQNLDEKEKDAREAKAALADRVRAIEKDVTRRLEADAQRGGEARAQESVGRVRDLKNQIDGIVAELAALDAEIRRVDDVVTDDAKGIVELERLTARANAIEERIRASKARAEVLETQVGIANPVRARTQEEAVVTQVPNPMRKKGVVAGAAVAGFLAGLLGMAFLDLRGQKIDTPQGVDRLLHTGIVGCIPRVSPDALAALTQPTGQPAGPDVAALCDAVDACSALLLNALPGDRCRVIMIGSAEAGEGKTTLAAQLALSLGRGGHRTLLIDGDMRKSSVHSLFGRSQSPGLVDVLRKTFPVERVGRRSPLPNLVIMPAGACHPHEAVSLLQLRLASVLRKCKPFFDVILIDTPPLNLPDAMVIGRHADGTILSLMNEVSTLPAAQGACARLRALDIPLLGAVLNAARLSAPVGY